MPDTYYLDNEDRLWEEFEEDEGVQLVHWLGPGGGDVLPLTAVEEYHGPLTVLVAATETSGAPSLGDRVTIEGTVISFLSGGKEARVRLDNDMVFSPAVISATPESLTVIHNAE